MIADKSDIKMKNTNDSYFRMLHYEKVQEAFYGNNDQSSDLSAVRVVLDEINSFFERQVTDSPEEFYKCKRDLERGYNLIIQYEKSYIESKNNYFSSDCEDMEITGEPAKKVITLHAFTVDNAQGKPDEFYGYFGSAFEREVERFIDMWTGDEK